VQPQLRPALHLVDQIPIDQQFPPVTDLDDVTLCRPTPNRTANSKNKTHRKSSDVSHGNLQRFVAKRFAALFGTRFTEPG
jgi:hypothetical protein